ncbi:MAG: tRNA pseudouridine(38-40) synthase TruA [Cytophagales bacterium]|nr:tRNA pseudouridine(38-40) synthase TruA [Cytophagales bacterium]
MISYILEISYHGGKYHGWQKQKNTPNTVQEALENALQTILKTKITTLAAGRTDVGVHARQQYVQIQPNNLIIDADILLYKLNALLGHDIYVMNIYLCQRVFSVRHNAIARTYMYYLRQSKDPFRQGLAGFYYIKNLDFDKMNEACKILLRYTDYQSFSKVKTGVSHFHCHIACAQWHIENDTWILTITADRFLRGMVRTIVGTLLEVGKEALSINDFENIIISKDRTKAKYAAKPEGLYLHNIKYEDGMFIKINV